MANAQAFRLDRSYNAVVNGAGDLLVRQSDSWRFQIPTLIAAIIVLFKWRRDVMLLAVSVGGIAGATVLFATWTRGYDSYWFLTLTTAMVLIYGMAIAAIPFRPAVQGIGVVLTGGDSGAAADARRPIDGVLQISSVSNDAHRLV